MPRPAKPYIHQGHYVTTKGGVYRRLCPVVDGFDRALAIMNDAPLPGALRLAELSTKYLAHCRDYYRRADGTRTRTYESVRQCWDELLAILGDTVATSPAERFTRAHLRAYRDALLTRSQHRKTINGKLAMIRAGFAWAVEADYLPDTVIGVLGALRPLKPNRSAAREPLRILPVAWETVAATLPHLPPIFRDLVRLQWLSGLRPGEACALRVEHCAELPDNRIRLDFGKSHKTAHRGRRRAVELSAEASEIVRQRRFLAVEKGGSYLFPGRHERTNARPLTASGYRHRVRKECLARGIPLWHPNQLRHSYATRVRAALGIEATQLALGHSSIDVTQVYAEQDEGLWSKITAIT